VYPGKFWAQDEGSKLEASERDGSTSYVGVVRVGSVF
jgi:hypothetical protein